MPAVTLAGGLAHGPSSLCPNALVYFLRLKYLSAILVKGGK